MNGMMNPQAALAQSSGMDPKEKLKQMMLMQQLQGAVGQNNVGAGAGAGLGNALAQGLQGYMLGKQTGTNAAGVNALAGMFGGGKA